MKQKNQEADQFAVIATQKMHEREPLEEPQPLAKTKTILPVHPATEPLFEHRRSIDSPEDLRSAVKTLRQEHEAFLKNHAPPLPVTRCKQQVDTFDWRIATDADHADNTRVFAGKGEWEQVTIPHYGEPLARATTFYRTQIDLDQDMINDRALFLCFKGVDYKAHVFLNQNYLGSHEGFFAPFQFECNHAARQGLNTVVVKVENDAIQKGANEYPYQGDKIYAATGPGYDDPQHGWHHCPPGMGIFQAVYFENRPRVHVHDLFLRPLPDLRSVEATVEVYNCDQNDRDLDICFSVFGRNFRETVCKNIDIEGLKTAGPTVNYYTFTFQIPQARIWDVKTPYLYQFQCKVEAADSKEPDHAECQFGIRHFTIDKDNATKGRMFLNNREIRLRGANTMGHMQQCVMKGDWEQLIEDILLAKVCHMNFWRLTQRPVQKEIYEYCDRLGILTQSDLPFFGVVRRNTVSEAVKQAEEMERLIRNHACNIMISYINEPFPKARGSEHRNLLRHEMQAFFEACDRVILLNNPDRVIKHVDGDYDPPCESLPDNHCYNTWYNGHALDLGRLHKGYWVKVKPEWRYACGEFGAEGLEDECIMQSFYPRDWLPQTPEEEKDWTPDCIRNAQTGRFHYMWFETKNSLSEWIQRSQEHQEWSVRLMTEAFRRDPRMNSFALHLFIDAFPSGWMKTIMDFKRRPKKAFYTWCDVLTPLIVNLRSDRHTFFARENCEIEVWTCNDLHQTLPGASIAYQLTHNSHVEQAGSSFVKIQPFTSDCQGLIPFTMPDVKEKTPLQISAALMDKDGMVMHTTQLEITAFPEYSWTQRSCWIPDCEHAESPARRLASALNMPSAMRANEAETILVSSEESYLRNADIIHTAIKKGGTVIILGLTEGKHTIADTEVVVKPCGMNPVHFVNRNTGHPHVKGFGENDFRFWYNEDAGYVTPLLAHTFDANGWVPILTSGNGGWREPWQPTLAAAEKKVGNGNITICLVELANRVKTSPVANTFARRLGC